MNNLTQLSFLLGSWATHLPTATRKRFYQGVKVLASLATLALLVLPMLPNMGVTLSDPHGTTVVLTALLALLGHVADRNTVVEPQVDVTPAPEPGNPTPPAAS